VLAVCITLPCTLDAPLYQIMTTQTSTARAAVDVTITIRAVCQYSDNTAPDTKFVIQKREEC
jgi:hypothetical protein